MNTPRDQIESPGLQATGSSNGWSSNDQKHAGIAAQVNGMPVPGFQIFGGSKSHRGNVVRLKPRSFGEFVASLPVQTISITRAEFHRLTKKERDQRKLVDYIVAATFKQSPSPRQTPHAVSCHVIFLDIDDPVEADRLLKIGFAAPLGDTAAVVWHTANSTPAKPRLRVMVRADGIPLSQYPAAVIALGSKLGLTAVTPESKVAVQQMYLPSRFAGEPPPTMVYSNPTGRAFDPCVAITPPSTPALSPDPTVADITYLSPPVEGVTRSVAEDVLSKIEPDFDYSQWIEIGMGLRHQFGDSGFALWDLWSSLGAKYEGQAATRSKWESFEGNCPGRFSVTFRSVIKIAKENGWDGESLRQSGMKEITQWICSYDRSGDELRSEGCSRIAALGLDSPLDRDELVKDLADALQRKLGTRPSLVALRKQLVAAVRKHCKAFPKPLPVWAKDFVYVGGNSNQFYSIKTGYRCPPVTFDHEHKRDLERDDKDPHDYLLNECQITLVKDYAYHPGRGQFFTDSRRFECVNTYQRSYTNADTKCIAKADTLIKRHFEDLIIDPDHRQTVMDFIAYMVQQPGEKILWALLLQGVEGSGKGTIADIASTVLGKTNIRRLEAGAALDSQFNDFAVGSQLVVFDEVRNIGENKFRVMEKLKPLITDPFVELNRKYETGRNVENVANYMLFTNHHDALPISDGDRRFFVLKSRLQSKDDLVARDVTRSCQELHVALQDYPGAFRALFEAHKISTGFSPKGRAPDTPYRQELSKSGESPLKAAIHDLLGAGASAYASHDLLSIGNLTSSLRFDHPCIRTTPQAVSNCLLEMNYIRLGEARIDGPSHRLWAKRGGKFEGRPIGDAVAAIEYRVQCEDVL